ncbi:hypothetical protein [Sulfuricurvum sp.]|uniref:hypothetical protein n=1 Tax=Sulfuricurvum sp. TaxID=2025608 RepID=UPI003565F687
MSVTFFAVLLILISTNASASALADAVTQSTGSILSDHYLVITALVALSIVLLSFDKILYLISEEGKVDKAYKEAFPKDSRSHVVKLTKQERAKRVLEYKKERLASVGKTEFAPKKENVSSLKSIHKQQKQQRQKIQRKNRNFRKLSKDQKFKRLDDFKSKKTSYEDKHSRLSSSLQTEEHQQRVDAFLESRQAKRQTQSENRHNSDWLKIPEPTAMEQYLIDSHERKRIQREMEGSFE